MKTQPITQKAKGSPFKMNETLVQGAADLGASTYTKKSKKSKPSPGNNQQPAQSISIDLTEKDSKETNKTNSLMKEENKDLINGDLDFALGSELFGIAAGVKQNPFGKLKKI